MVTPERAAAKARGHKIFDPIAEPYLAREGIDIGRMFGSEGLRVRGKIFAFLGFDGELVVKVPEKRATELTDSTPAIRMVMQGREMREWLVISIRDAERWPEFIAEAHDYLDRITP